MSEEQYGELITVISSLLKRRYHWKEFIKFIKFLSLHSEVMFQQSYWAFKFLLTIFLYTTKFAVSVQVLKIFLLWYERRWQLNSTRAVVEKEGAWINSVFSVWIRILNVRPEVLQMGYKPLNICLNLPCQFLMSPSKP